MFQPAECATVVPFPHRGEFRRPYGLGLLPGQLVVGLPGERSRVERLLGVAAGALADRVCDVQSPRGFWRHDVAHAVAQWHGATTSSRPVLSGFARQAPTRVSLLTALGVLADTGVRMHAVRLLNRSHGWGQQLRPQAAARLLLSAPGTYAALAGEFRQGAGAELWELELYANGCVFADTPGRLDCVLQTLTPIVAVKRTLRAPGGAPVVLLGPGPA